MSQTMPALLRRLLDEHQEMLPALQRWAAAMEGTDPQLARQQLQELAEGLRRHAELEEQTLFAKMAELLGSQALVGYEMQHDDIEEVLQELLAEPPGLPARARELADRLLWYCESHFEIEEKNIFPEALRRLSAEQWEALARRAGPS